MLSELCDVIGTYILMTWYTVRPWNKLSDLCHLIDGWIAKQPASNWPEIQLSDLCDVIHVYFTWHRVRDMEYVARFV